MAKLTDIEFLLLRFLSVLGTAHPYQLGRAIEDRGGQGVVSLGALYKAVHRLEEAGCVTSEWEDINPREAGRPRRRLYTITGLGQEALDRAVAVKAALELRPSPEPA